jgi:chromosome segregation ATPase
MDGIAELEQRIMAALARLDAGLERRVSASSSAAPSPAVMAELDHLREELDEERSANAQMNERLRAQRERTERVVAEMRGEIDRLARQVDEQALAMQRLVASTTQMREDLRRLRAAGPGGADAALLGKAADAEAGAALRAAEAADLANLVAALTPIVQAEELRQHG